MTETFTLITGASEGIGREFAKIAAARGRNVILSARNAEKLEALAAELSAEHGVQAVAIPADLAEPGGAEALWAKAAEGRKIDFLVNNAGLGRHGPFDAETPGDGGWERELASIQVNVVALTTLMKLAIPHLKEAERGRVLNVASLAGFTPGPGMAVYHATKAYVVSLSRAVREELADTDVTVTALCPGATESEFFKSANMRSARITQIGKPMSAKEVAEEGYDAAIRGDSVAVTGALNIVARWATKLLPNALVAPITKKVLAKV